ncbi:MAG: cytochrome b [Pasteurellaceae bacterium]|nr:cytochrome b [Pasteurellaceae bacterium]
MHSHSYPKPMIYLHWIVAVLAGVAYSSHGNPLVSEWQGQIHVASGLLLALFCLIRLGVRLKFRHAIPKHPLSKWQLVIAALVHGLLYLCLLAVPVTGLFALSLMTDSFSVFGISFTLPFFPEWQIDFSELHQRLANGFVLLAGLHALVALAHHFLWKDGVLRSMLGM